jgi:hypothetical protein
MALIGGFEVISDSTSVKDWLGRRWWLVPVIVAVVWILSAVISGYVRSPLDGWVGVPLEPGARRDEFYAAFWPGLYSGVISGILTGLVVGATIGLSILFTESHLEQRRSGAEIRADIARFRGAIRQSVWQKATPLFVPQDGIDAVPIGVRQVIEATESRPISLWMREVDDENGFLDRLNNLAVAYDDFLPKARGLDFLLELGAKKYLLSPSNQPNVSTANFEKTLVRYSLANILNRDEPTAIIMLGAASIAGDLQRGYADIQLEDRFEEVRDVYLEKLEQLEAARKELEQFLRY